MKRILKTEFLFCIFSIPVLWFLFSKMTNFFIDIADIDISGIPAYLGIIVAEIMVVIFRKKLVLYVFSNTGCKTAIAIFGFSVVCALCFRGMFLRGCANGGDALCLAGSFCLFAVFLCMLYKNFVYLSGRLKTLSFAKSDLCAVACIFVILNLEAVIYCHFMRKIFVWDNAGYFTTVHSLNNIFPGKEYFSLMYNSIFELDYNYVIMLPASLMCKIFGESRLVFVLSTINFYVFPLLVLIYVFSKRYFRLGNLKIFCIILALPYIVFMANTGFIDIGGVIPIFLAVVMYFFGNRDKNSVLTGVLLAVAVYMRRWFSFFALSFVMTVFIHSITQKTLKSFLEILCSFAFVLLFFTQDFVSRKLMADYGYIYSAYSLGFRTDIRLFTRYFGIILPCGLCLWAIIKQIRAGKKLQGESFVLLQSLISFCLFVSVQTHGQQHLALYLPAFITLLMSAMSATNKKTGIAVLALISCLQTANTFVPRNQPTSIQEITHSAIIPDFSNYPPVDENAEAILKVTEYMDREIGEKGKTVCFLSSSVKLNYDTLSNAEVSLSVKKKSNVNRSGYFYGISNVDKRDGFSEMMFATNYILVPSVLQIHLAHDEQKVIAVPYEEIVSGTGIGTAYKKENITFPLTDGTEIYLYRRIRDIAPEETERIRTKIFGAAK